MKIDAFFHAKMDGRGKIQIPKRERDARGWVPGTKFKVAVTRYEATENELYQLLRDEVLNRDGHKCQKCGSTRGLKVHHLIPRLCGGKDEPANLVTLCSTCHRRAHVATGQRGICNMGGSRR